MRPSIQSIDLTNSPSGYDSQVASQIIDTFLSGAEKPNARPEILAIGGGVAAGKDYLYDFFVKEGVIPKAAVLNDPDKVLHLLLGFQDDTKKDPAAAFLRWDPVALFIANQLLDRAIAEGFNITYLRTFALPDSLVVMRECCERFKYYLNAHIVTSSIDLAVKRSEIRAREILREVPEKATRTRHKMVSKFFPEIVAVSDTLSLWDNNVDDEKPRLIGTFVDDRSEIFDEAAYNQFLSQASVK